MKIFSIQTLSCLLISLVATSQSSQLDTIAKIDSDLDEVSAVEVLTTSNLYWVIEDAGNDNTLYGLDRQGSIVKRITIENAENDDWEDLASDNKNTLYIGDIGNNSENRELFSILKIKNISGAGEETQAEHINFTLPESVKSKDFEGFFLVHDVFYLFSKEKKETLVIKVPNILGTHEAQFVGEFDLKGKDTEITSADISADGKTVVLLNHDKYWKLEAFKGDDFFSGKTTTFDFNHDSQKEGICFKNNTTLIITDERDKSDDSCIYTSKLH